jgi:hypothetical protein
MNSTKDQNATDDSVWNYSAIARDFVVNTEPMGINVRAEELTNLLKMTRHLAELSVLKNLNLSTHELAINAQKEIKTARNEITFHNHLSLYVNK